MIKRLIRIETSLTPKQAVLLWLRQEHQGKTSMEYVQRIILQGPPSEAPRPRLGRLVVNRIRAAMQGQDPAQIQRAARQSAMQADFLFLLVRETNHAVLSESSLRWLRFALLLEQLRNAALWNEGQESDWRADLQDLATELSAIQFACERIRDQYFDGECILFKDAVEQLDMQTTMVQALVAVVDSALIESGHSELSTDSDRFRKLVSERALKKAGYIVALAKSEMLVDFGKGAAANAVLKPYVLKGE